MARRIDVVWGARSGRDDGRLKAWAMNRFYSLVRRIAIPSYPKGGTGSFCLITAPVMEAFRKMNERNRLTFGSDRLGGFPRNAGAVPSSAPSGRSVVVDHGARC